MLRQTIATAVRISDIVTGHSRVKGSQRAKLESYYNAFFKVCVWISQARSGSTIKIDLIEYREKIHL